ncbi:MAG TPA: SapC family protein [Gammaproteobacteria bacterium]|nr:SapC family protein [Gammaproteobacteria bacterium]
MPPGYSRLVALDSRQHRKQKLVPQRQRFAARLTSVPLMAAEFVQAARHYPIVFAADTKDSTQFVPLAVTGLEQDINLFMEPGGVWAVGQYLPAHVRCWPFYGAHVRGGKDSEILICVDPDGLAVDGEELFDAEGAPGAALRAAQALIRDLEAARGVTVQLCHELRRLDLLAPFEAHALPKQGREWRVHGMFRVDENRLNALDAEAVQRLMRDGMLSRIYAHLMSLDNFKFLMDRAVARRPVSSNMEH